VNNDIRWKQRLQNFENAFNVLQRRVEEYADNPTQEAYQRSLVQAFEMTQELSWKVLKDYLENDGYGDVDNARKVFKTAFQAEIITSDVEVWMQSIRLRNLTSHTYDEQILQEVIDFIQDKFYPSIDKLYHQLEKER